MPLTTVEIIIEIADKVYTLPDFPLPPGTVLRVKSGPQNDGYILLLGEKAYPLSGREYVNLPIVNMNEVSIRGSIVGDKFLGIVHHDGIEEDGVDTELYEALKEADEIICELCKRLNPQHVSTDYGKGCDWCQDRDTRLKLLAKVGGKE